MPVTSVAHPLKRLVQAQIVHARRDEAGRFAFCASKTALEALRGVDPTGALFISASERSSLRRDSEPVFDGVVEDSATPESESALAILEEDGLQFVV